jgi:hypothetical protein
MMHLYEHETPPASLVISISMFQYTSILSTPKPFDTPLSDNLFCFYGQFNNRCHNNNKILMKHL